MEPVWPTLVQDTIAAARRLPAAYPAIVAIALVGSWARGAGRPDSDVDLLVLTEDPAQLLDRSDWFAHFDPQARLVRSRDFEAIQERRLLLRGGLEVEVGIGSPGWASTDRVDEGTAAVVADGMVILHDSSGCLADLSAWVARYGT